MQLEKALSAPYSKTGIDKIVAYVGKDPVRFKRLAEIVSRQEKEKLSLASACLSFCVENHPELMLPHLSSLLKLCQLPKVDVAYKRNIIRSLQFIEIPARQQGKVLALCFSYLENRKESIAVRVFAMSVLGKLVQQHPDLQQELYTLLELELPMASAGFQSRAKKILKMKTVSLKP